MINCRGTSLPWMRISGREERRPTPPGGLGRQRLRSDVGCAVGPPCDPPGRLVTFSYRFSALASRPAAVGRPCWPTSFTRVVRPGDSWAVRSSHW